MSGATELAKALRGRRVGQLHRRDLVTGAAVLKLAVFTLISVLCTGLLAVIMGNIGLGPTRHLRAVFSDASGLQPGDDVRIAGVNVGKVDEVEHDENFRVVVSFSVEEDAEVTTDSRAEIRFLNLIGDRYMAIERGERSAETEVLEDDGVIPIEQTSPSLDLTVLFDGFKPLFQALTPDQVNELSMNLVQVLQGEGGTVRGLLEHTASLTSTLADRDKLIGQLVTNLSETLDTVNQRRGQLSALVVELRDWMRGLAADRQTIGGSLDNISDLTVAVADLLRQGRPHIKGSIHELRRLAELLNRPENRALLVELLERLPESMTDQTRTGTYGSWYNYYVCGAQGTITLPVIGNLPVIRRIQAHLNDFAMHSTAPRCNR